ncbi:nadh-ubiquinone oxidoreductase mwfe subunit [Holotrichia oblita]|uniref:Nadh-ubiquinone oxidoreductase mwfe subunit n=2 Tax=Holotrichia oblita TaxID=644536 RepID=A0ACB9T2C7_HOLOL|nr:nadh-ubiquinone oxidoreductase mwfe subunit [Holotrichia oblita]KAI4460962.1 nadh-ubiquinone oxidoreductase mwfe subunit [Holotrichia oblita]
MWYEILPAYTIITVALACPAYIAAGLNFLVLGKIFRRRLESTDSRLMYMRDKRLTGNPYILNGLEAIPDTEEQKALQRLAEEDVERDQCPANFAEMTDEEMSDFGKGAMEDVCKEPK